MEYGAEHPETCLTDSNLSELNGTLKDESDPTYSPPTKGPSLEDCEPRVNN